MMFISENKRKDSKKIKFRSVNTTKFTRKNIQNLVHQKEDSI